LTPEILSDVEFRERLRGYHPDDVDDFLEQVALAVSELRERLTEAEARAEDLTRPPSRHAGRGARPPHGVTGTRPAGEAIAKTTLMAERAAKRTMAKARDEAAAFLHSAREEEGGLRAEVESLTHDREGLAADRDRLAAECKMLTDERASLSTDRDHLVQETEALMAVVEDVRARLRTGVVELLDGLDRLGAERGERGERGMPASAGLRAGPNCDGPPNGGNASHPPCGPGPNGASATRAAGSSPAPTTALRTEMFDWAVADPATFGTGERGPEDGSGLGRLASRLFRRR